MKNLNLTIPNACAENWRGFTPTHNGAFCDSCSTEVIDFTKMSDAEIVAHFSKSTNQTCGLFQAHQLKMYPSLTEPFINPGFKLLKAGLLVLMMGLVSHSGFANHEREKSNQVAIQRMVTLAAEHIVKGVIKSEDGGLMPGVNIYLKNGDEGTISDEDGEFEFPRKLKSGEVLVFSFIGYEKVEYVVLGELTEPIEITMVFDTHIILGKVAIDDVYEEPGGIQKIFRKVKRVF